MSREMFPAPICAVCNKEVEIFSMEHSVYEDTYRFYIQCHGEEDYGHLTSHDMRVAHSIGPGRVFERLALQQPNRTEVNYE